MKLTCDLCGGELQRKPDGAVCANCGMEYDEERLREKIDEQKTVTPSEPPVWVAPPTPMKPTAAEQNAQMSMKWMWIILALIGVVAFVGGLMESGIVYVGCVVAAVITLFIFKPWNVYGGKAI